MSDEEITVTITMKEYKELLITKGRYEELKEGKKDKKEEKKEIVFRDVKTAFDDDKKDLIPPYKVTCNLPQHDCDVYGNKPQIKLNDFSA